MPSLTKVQSGFIEAQGALPLSSGTAAAPGLKFDDSTGTGMFSPSTGVIGFSTGNAQSALTIGSDGQLGIGGANYGTDGQVLTSTGANSAPAWEDAAGGGGGALDGLSDVTITSVQTDQVLKYNGSAWTNQADATGGGGGGGETDILEVMLFT